MGNNMMEASIPLEGSGFVVRPQGNYKPGEFKRLMNLEFTLDGNLQTRPNVRPCSATSGSGLITYPNQHMWWLGHFFEVPVVRTQYSSSLWVGLREAGLGNDIQFPMTGYDSTGIHPNLQTHNFVGCFMYNKRAYWISFATFNPTNLYQYMVHKSTFDCLAATGVPTQYSFYTHHVVVSNSATVPVSQSQQAKFVKHFIHKDRLWIITNKTAYFSKATDPTVWTVPDGGFFNFPDEQLTDAVPIGNSIYLFFQNSIKLLTYNTDPNTDSVLTTISTLGTDSAVAYRDAVLFISSDTLYSITGTHVQKLRDINLKLEGAYVAQYVKIILTMWEDRLIIQYRIRQTYTVSSPIMQVTEYGSHPMQGQYYTQANRYNYPTYTYILNMATDCLWEFDFVDQLEFFSDVDDSHPGWPELFYVVPYENSRNVNGNTCYFYSVHIALGGLTMATREYFLVNSPTPPTGTPPAANSYETYDRVYTAANVYTRTTKPLIMEIDGWTPDESELYMRKFRSLVVEGRLPEVDDSTAPNLFFSFGNGVYTPTNGHRMVDTTEPASPPVPYRFPINQRGRNLGIRIEQRAAYKADPATNYVDDADFAISRLTVLWSYLQRLPTKRGGTDT